MIAGIVLGAGRSRRMGVNKLLIEFDGEPLVRRVVQTALSAALEPVVVVTGPSGDARRRLSGLPVEHCVRATSSQRESLAAGLGVLPPTVDGALILLADMPLVTEAMLDRVRDALTPSVEAVAARYGDVLAPPVLVTRAAFRAATSSAAGSVVRHLNETLTSVAYVDFPIERLLDIDTAEDVERARSMGLRAED